MRVIDLLNKIANGEEVPKKIRINNIIFEYRGDDYLSKNENHEWWLFSNGYAEEFEWLDSFLKTEVEIIEEQNARTQEHKIPENLPFNNEMKLTIMEVYHELERYNYKINEIIDYLEEENEYRRNKNI